MKYINAGQIRAARALLNWSQEELALSSNLSVTTIRKLELGHISPRAETTRLIRTTFESCGLEFLEPNGVRQRPDDITIYQGAEEFEDFYDDVYQTVKKNGGEIVGLTARESDFTDILGNFLPDVHSKRMLALKDRVSVKCIVTKDEETPAPYCDYRWLSTNYVDPVPFYIYGNKYAAIMFDHIPSPKVIVIESIAMAEAFRRQFYSMWEKSKPLHPSNLGKRQK